MQKNFYYINKLNEKYNIYLLIQLQKIIFNNNRINRKKDNIIKKNNGHECNDDE